MYRYNDTFIVLEIINKYDYTKQKLPYRNIIFQEVDPVDF